MLANKKISVESINSKYKTVYGRSLGFKLFSCRVCSRNLNENEFAVHFFNYHYLELTEKEKKVLVEHVLDDCEEKNILVDNTPVPFYPGVEKLYCPPFSIDGNLLGINKFKDQVDEASSIAMKTMKKKFAKETIIISDDDEDAVLSDFTLEYNYFESSDEFMEEVEEPWHIAASRRNQKERKLEEEEEEGYQFVATEEEQEDTVTPRRSKRLQTATLPNHQNIINEYKAKRELVSKRVSTSKQDRCIITDDDVEVEETEEEEEEESSEDSEISDDASDGIKEFAVDTVFHYTPMEDKCFDVYIRKEWLKKKDKFTPVVVRKVGAHCTCQSHPNTPYLKKKYFERHLIQDHFGGIFKCKHCSFTSKKWEDLRKHCLTSHGYISFTAGRGNKKAFEKEDSVLSSKLNKSTKLSIRNTISFDKIPIKTIKRHEKSIWGSENTKRALSFKRKEISTIPYVHAFLQKLLISDSGELSKEEIDDFEENGNLPEGKCTQLRGASSTLGR